MKPSNLWYFSTRSSRSSHGNLFHCMRRTFLLGWQGRWRRCKTSNGGHTSGSSERWTSLLLSTIIRQELFEIVQEIRSTLKKSSDLSIDFLNRTLFPLISLQNLKKVLVDVGFISKTSLPISNCVLVGC